MGGKGIFGLLVKAAEDFLVEATKKKLRKMKSWAMAPRNKKLRITVPVMSARKELVAFYSKLGYQPGQIHDIDWDPNYWDAKGEFGVELAIFYKDVEAEQSD